MKSTLSKANENEISKLICRSAKAYFENEDNRRAFEKWYFENYGQVYKWETNKEKKNEKFHY